MSKPTLLYPVTLVQDGGAEVSALAPSLIALPVQADEQMFAILEQDVGEQEQGFYVQNAGRWNFAIPYPAISAGVIFAESISVYINPTAPVTFDQGAVIYKNGVMVNGLTIIPDDAIFAVMAPANKTIEPYVLPPATSSVIGGVMVPAGSKIALAPNGAIDVDPALISDINSKISGVVNSGTGVSLIRSTVGGVVTLKSLKANTGLVLNDDGAGTLTVSGMPASASALGMIKVGAGLTVAGDGTLSTNGLTSVTLTGDVTGTGAGTVPTTLSNTGVVAGAYTKVTVDAKGRVILGAQLNNADVVAGLGYTPYDAANPAGYITGNQNITVTGDVTGSGTNSLALTLANAGTAGTYTKVTTDAKGRVISGSNPTTLAGYGITDAVSKAGDTMTGNLLFSGAFTVRVPTPVTGTDSANKDYVDQQISAVASGTTWKANVVVATTANITLSGLQTIDGVALAAGNRVLVKDQTDPKQNGIWIAAAGAWTRATDADTGTEIQGAAVLALQGTVNQLTQWINTNSTTPVIGTDNITFTRFQGGGQAYTAGTGLTLSSNQFSITDTGVVAGTYTKVTVNAQGQVTTGAQLSGSDVNTALGYTAYNGTANPNGFLTTNQSITLSGDAAGTGTTAISVVLANSGVSAGTYSKVTVDAKGRVTVGANLSSADISTALGYTAVNRAGDTMTGALNWATSVSVAAAATTDIGSAASNSISVTGTASVTALGTAPAGAERLVTFTGTPTLTHNAASLILPTSANIVVAAGDSAIFMSLGSGNWRCVSYTRADGTALSSGSGGDPTKLPLAGGTMTGAINGAAMIDVVVQGSFNLGSAAANSNHIRGTGTGSISIMSSAPAGTVKEVFFVSAGSTIVHTAGQLELPGAANISIGAGDTAAFINMDGAVYWKCLWYTRASGAPIVNPGDSTRIAKAGGLTEGQMTGSFNEASGVTLAASAGTATNIGAVAGNTVLLSGSGITITGFSGGQNGMIRRVQFGGAMTLQASATFVIPASPITTANKDWCTLYYHAANAAWYMTSYLKADGTALVAPASSDPTKLPLAGGSMTGAINMSTGTASISFTSAGGALNYGPINQAGNTGSTFPAGAQCNITNWVSNYPQATPLTGLTGGTAGMTRKFTVATGISVYMTNSANFALIGNADMAAFGGDSMEFLCTNAAPQQWKMINFQRYTGLALTSDSSKVNKAGDSMTGTLNMAPHASMAAADPLNITSQASNDIDVINGVTVINSLGTGNDGQHRTLTFTGTNNITLTYNATSLVLPGAASIATRTGDRAEFVCRGGSNWTCLWYTRADGTAIVAGSSFTGGTLTGALNFAPTTTLTAAATVNIGAAATNSITITGTTGINTFDTIAAGATRYLVFSSTGGTIGNNANIILPTAAGSLTIFAGDSAEFISQGSGVWKCLWWMRKDGTPVTTPNDTTKVAKAGDAMTGKLELAAYIDVPSALTTDLTNVASNNITISGTNTITSFGTGVAGAVRKIRFTGTPLLGTGIGRLPGGANIQTAVGDYAEFIGQGSGSWDCLVYTKANGQSITGAPDNTKLPLAGGQMTGAINWTALPTVTAAATIDWSLAGNQANFVKVTGATQITTFASGTSGMVRGLFFASAGSLGTSGNLILPGGSAITTAVGDYAEFIYNATATSWYLTNYFKADGTSLVASPDATKLPLAGGTMSGAVNYAPTITVGGGASMNLGGQNANSLLITGTGIVFTSFGTAAAGITRKLTWQSAAGTLTYNATSMILPTAANISIQAGDTAEFLSLGSGNWQCLWYVRASGQALVGAPDATKLPLAGGTMTGAINEASAVNVASAASPNIGAIASNTLVMTGSVTITSFAGGANGMRRTIFFSGAPLLTNGANLVLPGAANIQTASGDFAEFYYHAFNSTWYCISYTKANGTALLGGTGQSSYTVGDMLYANSTSTLAKVSGNTTTARQFLMQQGNGTTMTSIAFSAIAESDVTGLVADLASKVSSSSPTLSGVVTLTGNLAFSGTGQRILGDFSNATHGNRVMFQTSTANSSTIVGAIPSGTGTSGQYNVYNNSDPNNSTIMQLGVNGTNAYLTTVALGAGTNLPMVFNTAGVERFRIHATTPRLQADFSSGTTSQFMFQDQTLGNLTSVGAVPNLASGLGTAQFAAFNASDNTNAAFIRVGVNGSVASVRSDAAGTGTLLPLTLHAGAFEMMRLDTAGNASMFGVTPTSNGTNYRTLSLGTSGAGSDGAILEFKSGSTVRGYLASNNGAGLQLTSQQGLDMLFYTGSGTSPVERMRLSSSANRLQADWTNASVSSQMAFQTSVVNSLTSVNIVPNGTATQSQIVAFNNSAPDNSSYTRMGTNGTLSYLTADRAGTGTFLPLTFNTGGAEAMRIDTSGNIMFGITTSGDPVGIRTNGTIINQSTKAIYSRSTVAWELGLAASSGLNMQFYTDNGSAYVSAGSISSNGATTAFNTSSDYRIKVDPVPMVGALESLKQIQFKTWKWVVDGRNGEGVVAHELQGIDRPIEDAVHGEKDGVKEDGTPIFQSVDYSKLVPRIGCSVQELAALYEAERKRNDELEARIAKLEALLIA